MKKLSWILMLFITCLALESSVLAQIPRGRGWVLANNPTSSSYIPDLNYQSNSAGGTNRIDRLSRGYYQVRFPGLATSGGTAQVSAYGGPHYCNVEGWLSSGADMLVIVRSYDSNGTPVDGRFTLLFYKEQRGTEYNSAYLWADQETVVSYTPHRTYQFNSKGSVNTIRRLGVGMYEAFFPGVARGGVDNNKGTVLVSAYGSALRRAKVASWGESGDGIAVRISTFDVRGDFADSKFTVSFTKDVIFGVRVSEDPLNTQGAFLWASQPSAAFYKPDMSYQYNNNAFNISATVTRLAAGLYTVNVPWKIAANKTIALVTAAGGDSAYATIVGWYRSGEDTTVRVQCYNTNGQPADASFTLSYLTNKPIIW